MTNVDVLGGTPLVTRFKVLDTGLPSEKEDPNLNVTSYSYSNVAGYDGAYLTSTQFPNTTNPYAGASCTQSFVHSVTAEYDVVRGLITKYTDQNSQSSTFDYDNMRRLTSAIFPLEGGQTHFYYPDALTVERQQQIDSSRFNDLFVRFDGLGREIRRAVANDESTPWNLIGTAYDSRGNVQYKTYPYQGSGINDTADPYSKPGDAFSYDGLRRPVKTQHADGSFVTTEYFGSSVKVTDETRTIVRASQSDALGRLKQVCEVSSTLQQGTSPSPATCSFETNLQPTGFLTVYNYNPRGDLLSVQQGGLSSRSFTYDGLSRLKTATNPESGTTSYNYDANGNVIQRLRPAPNQFNPTTQVSTSYQYDALNRLIQTSYANDPTATPAVVNTWDCNGLGVTPNFANGRLGRIDTVNTKHVFAYDSMGRPWQNLQRTPLTYAAADLAETYTYDYIGEITSHTNDAQKISGNPVKLSYLYNIAGGLLSVSSSANDANHPPELMKNIHYGAFGLAAAEFGNGWTEARTYDSLSGRLLSDSNGGRQATSGTPGTGNVSISGTVQSQQVQTQAATSGQGWVVIGGVEKKICDEYIGSRCGHYSYDHGTVSVTVNGYVASVGYSNSSTAQSIANALATSLNAGPVIATVTTLDTQSFRIDVVARTTGAATNYSFSATSSTTDPGLFVAPSFRPTSISGSALTGGSDIQYATSYDSGSATVTIQGTPYQYLWGANDTALSIAQGLASRVTAGGLATGSAVSVDAQHANINLTAVMAGSQINTVSTATTSTLGLNSFSMSGSGAIQGGTDPGFTVGPVYSYSLDYFSNGNPRTANDSVNGNWSYVYDEFNRLSSAARSNAASLPAVIYEYKYDRFGNRWQQNVTAGSGFNTQLSFDVNNRMTGLAPDGNPLYDAAGNQRYDMNSGAYFVYDAENRLVSVPNQNTTYVYNGKGERVEKNIGGVKTDYVYDLAGHVITGFQSLGDWQRGEIYAGGRHLGTYTPTMTYFAFSDWLGTERYRTDNLANMYQLCNNLPFGDGQNCQGAEISPLHFTGKERDSETGLDYFGARYYGSNMGRFLSPDEFTGGPINLFGQNPNGSGPLPYAEITNPQSLNKYAFTWNNPLRYVDPDGHLAEDSNLVSEYLNVIEVKGSVKAGVGGSVQLGTAEFKAGVLQFGAEGSTGLAGGNADAKATADLFHASVDGGALPLKGSVNAGAEVSVLNGAKAGAKAELSAPGLKAGVAVDNKNGVTTSGQLGAQATTDWKLGGSVGVVAGVGVKINFTQLGRALDATSDSLNKFVQYVGNKFLPNGLPKDQ